MIKLSLLSTRASGLSVGEVESDLTNHFLNALLFTTYMKEMEIFLFWIIYKIMCKLEKK